MNIDEFLTDIQNTYGKYKPGMYSFLRKDLIDCPEESLEVLADCLKKEWDKSAPPTYKEIARISNMYKISIGIKNLYDKICEFCYLGIEPVKNINGRFTVDMAHIFNWEKIPRKIVLLSFSKGNKGICPDCYNTEILGLWRKRVKSNNNIEIIKNNNQYENDDDFNKF